MLAAVVLAAGSSRRMGARNKLLIELRNEPIIRRVVRAVLASRVEQVLVVTGHERSRVEQALQGLSVRFAHNPDFAQGMSTSVRTGVEALTTIDTNDEAIEGALFILGDMPELNSDHINALIDAFAPAEGDSICVPIFEGKRGNPVLFAAHHFEAMRALRGDKGARRLLAEHPDEVRYIEMPDSAVLLDIDTPAELAKLERPHELDN